MSSTEEEQKQQSSNIGEENSNVPPNSESTDQQRDVTAEMASSLARSAEISGELPRPNNNNDNDKLAKTSSISSSTSTVLSPLQRKLIADQNSRIGSSSIDNRSFGTTSIEEGRSIENTTNRSVDQSITSSIYGSTVDSHHSWNPVSSVASSSLGRQQPMSSSSRERVVDQTQDVNNEEDNVLPAVRVNHQDDTSTVIEIGPQNNNVQPNNNIEQQQQQLEEEQPSIAISNMDQIGNAERRQSRRRSTQETDGTPIAIPVDSVHSSRRSRQRVPIFNATRIDTNSNHRNEEEEDGVADGRRKRKRQVCMVCFLIVIIGGLSVILGILLSPTNNDNGEDTSDEIQEVEVLSVPISSTEPSTQPSQSISTSLPSIQPTITTIPTESLLTTSSPSINPTQSPTQILYHADWSMSMCINDPKDRPVGYSIVQGRQPLFQTLEACCNSQFWWDVDGCLMRSNGSATFVEQTVSPSLNPTTPPSIMMTSLSPITLVPSASPLQSPIISSSPTKSPTELPTRFPTNQPTSKAPTRQPITSRPTDEPSKSPSDSPILYSTTSVPSNRPTNKPTTLPTRMMRTTLPTTLKPTPKPTLIITSRPTSTPEKIWQPLGNVISGNGRFGYSVSLSSDAKTLAIGAPNYSNNESNTNIGQVQIYTWVESTWQQFGQSIPGKQNGDEFGTSISLSSSGLTLAVSSPKSNTNGESSAGLVSVYTWDEATSLWQQVGQTITEDGGWCYDVSLDGDGTTLVGSAPNTDSAGDVRVFQFTSEEEI